MYMTGEKYIYSHAIYHIEDKKMTSSYKEKKWKTFGNERVSSIVGCVENCHFDWDIDYYYTHCNERFVMLDGVIGVAVRANDWSNWNEQWHFIPKSDNKKFSEFYRQCHTREELAQFIRSYPPILLDY